MSENARPITGELRERINLAERVIPLNGEAQDQQVRVNLAWLEERLDAIDAIHANLERENDELEQENANLKMQYINANRKSIDLEHMVEDLKAEQDRVLGEQDEAEHRGWTRGYDEGFAAADDWLADNEDAMEEHGWVRLPKDADGEYIHIGDVMEHTNGVFTVTDMTIGDDGVWRAWDGKNGHTVQLAKCHHHKPDTWERIIDDAEALAREWFNTDMSENEHADGLDALVARCKALAGDAE